jgi:hypothetical protein
MLDEDLLVLCSFHPFINEKRKEWMGKVKGFPASVRGFQTDPLVWLSGRLTRNVEPALDVVLLSAR